MIYKYKAHDGIPDLEVDPREFECLISSKVQCQMWNRDNHCTLVPFKAFIKYDIDNKKIILKLSAKNYEYDVLQEDEKVFCDKFMAAITDKDTGNIMVNAYVKEVIDNALKSDDFESFINSFTQEFILANAEEYPVKLHYHGDIFLDTVGTVCVENEKLCLRLKCAQRIPENILKIGKIYMLTATNIITFKEINDTISYDVNKQDYILNFSGWEKCNKLYDAERYQTLLQENTTEYEGKSIDKNKVNAQKLSKLKEYEIEW